MKTLNALLIFAGLALLCSASTCRKDGQGHGDDRLTFVNNGDKRIMALLQFNYPDTSINDEKRSKAAYTTIGLNPHTIEKFWNSINWEDDIKERNPQHTLTVFFFSSDTIQKYPWDTIRSQYKVLKRQSLTVDQLKGQNWTVTYP